MLCLVKALINGIRRNQNIMNKTRNSLVLFSAARVQPVRSPNVPIRPACREATTQAKRRSQAEMAADRCDRGTPFATRSRVTVARDGALCMGALLLSSWQTIATDGMSSGRALKAQSSPDPRNHREAMATDEKKAGGPPSSPRSRTIARTAHGRKLTSVLFQLTGVVWCA
jgi:hypothetical protein